MGKAEFLPDDAKALLLTVIDDEHLQGLLAVRRAKRAPLSMLAVRGLLKKWAEHPPGPNDAVEQMATRGWTGFDVAIATPEAMKEVRKLGRVLGPRGLMPNPKTGTVTDDTAAAVEMSRAGKVEFRMDRHGNICVLFGKLSFDKEKLIENAESLLRAIHAERPAAAKGTYIRNCTVSSSMGVGVNVILKD